MSLKKIIVLALGLMACEMITAEPAVVTTEPTTTPINTEKIIVDTLGQALGTIAGTLTQEIFNEIKNQVTTTETDFFTKKMELRKQLNPDSTGLGETIDNAILSYIKIIAELISEELNNQTQALKTTKTLKEWKNHPASKSAFTISEKNKTKLETAKQALKTAVLAEFKITE